MEELLWITGALIVGGVIVWLVMWLREKRVAVKWWEWTIGGLGLLAIVLGIQHYVGSVAEGYSTPGLIGLAIFAIPGLVMILIINQLVIRRHTANKN